MDSKMTGLTFKLHEMASRIRELRLIEGWTEEEMAVKTGVTLEEYMACADAGVGTFIGMHATPEVVEGLKKFNKCNLIIAGHMASDSLGFNQILDAWEAKGIEVVRISGIV